MISSSGAKSAAGTQAQAADQAAQVQQNMFNTTQQNLQPWISAGGNALSMLQQQLGLQFLPGTGGQPAAAGTPAPGATTGGAAPAGGGTGQLTGGYSVVNTGSDMNLIDSKGNVVTNFPVGTPMDQIAASVGQTIGTPSTQPQTTGAAAGVPGQTMMGPNGVPNGIAAQFSPLNQSGVPTSIANQFSPLNASGMPTSIANGFQSSPGYQWQLGQGMETIQNSAAGKGGLMGGNTLKALQTYGQGLANQDYYNYLGTSLNQYNNAYGTALNQYNNQYGTALNQSNNYINQLAALSGSGQNAGANLGSLGASAATNIGNNLINAGQANAAGTVGQANAINSGIGQVTNGLGQTLMGGNNNAYSGLGTSMYNGLTSLGTYGNTGGQGDPGTNALQGMGFYNPLPGGSYVSS